MRRDGGQYHLIFKDETAKPVKKYLRLAAGRNIEGPFKELSEPFTPSWVEGPTALKIGDQYIVYYDMYRDKKYGAMRSKNLKQWEDISTQLSIPQGTRHGTAFKVSRELLASLMKIRGGR